MPKFSPKEAETLTKFIKDHASPKGLVHWSQERKTWLINGDVFSDWLDGTNWNSSRFSQASIGLDRNKTDSNTPAIGKTTCDNIIKGTGGFTKRIVDLALFIILTQDPELREIKKRQPQNAVLTDIPNWFFKPSVNGKVEWFEYHFTVEDHEPKLAKSKLTLDPEKPDHWQFEVLSPIPLKYDRVENTPIRENKTLLFQFYHSSSLITETLTLRYAHEISSSKIIEGYWSGVDFHLKPTIGTSILSKYDIDSCPQHFERITERLKKHEDIVAYGPNHTKIIEQWDQNAINTQIKDLEEETVIRIQCTYIPNEADFYKFLRELEKKKGVKITFNILMMDQNASDLFNGRFSLMKNEAGESAEDFKKRQTKQIEMLKKLSIESSTFKINIQLFNKWMSGHCFEIGKHSLHIGMMFATESAIRSPTIVTHDPEIALWESFNNDFESMWNPDPKN